jgi:hypothetical protein
MRAAAGAAARGDPGSARVPSPPETVNPADNFGSIVRLLTIVRRLSAVLTIAFGTLHRRGAEIKVAANALGSSAPM